jgi:uncharacterized membrane protein
VVRPASEYEERFRRAGLPLLIEGYSAREDIFTRAYPLLAVVLLGELLGALNLEWSTAANVAAVLGGLAIMVGALALANRMRGRRTFARPEEIGPVELAGFVLLPALLPLVFGGQVTSALVTAAANLALLGVVYVVVGFAVLWIVWWAARRLAGQLARSLLLLARAIPLLLLFAVVLFITTETWQTFGDLAGARLASFAALLLAIEWAFLAARLPREVEALEREASADVALRPAQRANIGLVMFISQTLQVLVVSLAVGAFFIALGLIVVTPELLDAWLGHTGDELLRVRVLGFDARLTSELLRVSAALAALSALYYSISLLTDSTYRDEFLAEITDELRDTFAARSEYLAALAKS